MVNSCAVPPLYYKILGGKFNMTRKWLVHIFLHTLRLAFVIVINKAQLQHLKESWAAGWMVHC